MTDPVTPSLPPSEVPKLKGWMRNKPCLCGSGKKFKKCCMATYFKVKNKKEKVI
ncbi:SEC-C domain-containing protein [Candidatus Pacearchaeota archaeon]|nr:SEC-C domain-containing protein [Candidatus Pacearchaeota archaeon]